jgi:hypothetical protein
MGALDAGGRRGRADRTHAENLTDPVRFSVRGVPKGTNSKHSPPFRRPHPQPVPKGRAKILEDTQPNQKLNPRKK